MIVEPVDDGARLQAELFGQLLHLSHRRIRIVFECAHQLLFLLLAKYKSPLGFAIIVVVVVVVIVVSVHLKLIHEELI